MRKYRILVISHSLPCDISSLSSHSEISSQRYHAFCDVSHCLYCSSSSWVRYSPIRMKCNISRKRPWRYSYMSSSRVFSHSVSRRHSYSSLRRCEFVLFFRCFLPSEFSDSLSYSTSQLGTILSTPMREWLWYFWHFLDSLFFFSSHHSFPFSTQSSIRRVPMWNISTRWQPSSSCRSLLVHSWWSSVRSHSGVSIHSSISHG